VLIFNNITNNYESGPGPQGPEGPEGPPGDPGVCSDEQCANTSICELEQVDCDNSTNGDVLIFNNITNNWESGPGTPGPPGENGEPGQNGTCSDEQCANATLSANCESFDLPCDCENDDDCPGTLFVHPQHSLYVCSCDERRWVGISEHERFGEERKICKAGRDLLGDRDCNVDWGDTLGASDNGPGLPESGLYVPHDFVITSVGFASFENSCTGEGSFDVKICWTSDNNTIDYAPGRCETLLSGLSDTNVANDRTLSVFVPGHRYVTWGIDNNCVQSGGGGNDDNDGNDDRSGGGGGNSNSHKAKVERWNVNYHYRWVLSE
jgi:hypothetical protein